MEGVQQFVQARLADLTAAQGLASKAWQDRTLPVWSDIPASSLYTTLAGMVLVQVLFAMATSKGRRLVFDVVETILAIILICVLLAIVIGLPIGAWPPPPPAAGVPAALPDRGPCKGAAETHTTAVCCQPALPLHGPAGQPVASPHCPAPPQALSTSS